MYLGRYINISAYAQPAPAPYEAPTQPSQQFIRHYGQDALISFCGAIQSHQHMVSVGVVETVDNPAPLKVNWGCVSL